MNDCLMSIDGTDFRIPQQGPAVKGNPFSSHKFKGKCALRYELGVDIVEGNLVWIEGPCPAGKCSDIVIFRQTLIHHLDPFERVVADDGYIGEAPVRVKAPGLRLDSSEDRAMQSVVRSRHETLNGRFKFWEILKQPFRHDILEHGQIFRAIAVIIQLGIDEGDKLFSVVYSD